MSSITPEERNKFVDFLASSIPHVFRNLRSGNVASSHVDPWVPLRIVSVYLAMANCLEDKSSHHIQAGRSACDKLVQILAAITWIKHLHLVVIPVIKQFRGDAAEEDRAAWSALIDLLEAGVKSLVKALVDGRIDVRIGRRRVYCLSDHLNRCSRA